MNYTVHPGTTGSLELKSFWCYVDRLSFNMAEDLNLSDASNAPSDTVNKGSNITVHVIFIFLKYVTLSDDFCFCFFFQSVTLGRQEPIPTAMDMPRIYSGKNFERWPREKWY